jgi:hypothetical protein
MGKPDFIGIGTERSGTSWVFSMLAHHPDIWVPPLKELHYFDTKDPELPTANFRLRYHLKTRLKHKLIPLIKRPHRPELYKNSYIENLIWDYHYFSKKIDANWYQNLFSEKFIKGKICGEYTPAYCNISAELIKQTLDINKNLKYIILIRNPLDQIQSSLIQNFVMIEGRNIENVSINEMETWLKSPAASFKANLKTIFDKWNKLVPKEQLFVGHYEQINEEPETLIKALYSFLGVDNKFLPDKTFIRKKINKLTPDNFKLPQNIIDNINERFEKELLSFTDAYPEYGKSWRINNDK